MKIDVTYGSWCAGKGVWVKGYAYVDDKLYSGESLLALIDGIGTYTALEKCLKSLNGLYAIIIDKPSLTTAAVDPSRIYPLFYTCTDGTLSISDTAGTLLRGGETIDAEALAEYTYTGAPFAGKTLVSGLLQVKPGHYLMPSEGGMEQRRFFRYNVARGQAAEASLSNTAKAFDNAFKRTFESICGRQIVIPLSGGYDSRIVASQVKMHGCKDVLCYTYGKDDNPDCVAARTIAEHLGFDIIHIDTSKCDIELESDADYQKYVDFIGCCGNFMWISDYLACRTLIKMGALKPDAVFIPGHLGNFLAGGHIQRCRLNPDATPEEMAEALMRTVFEYGYARPLKPQLTDYYRKAAAEGDHTPSVYLSFIIENRKAHIIDNAARVYEYLGYDVRLPFWDKELLELFSRATLNQLADRELYNTYATEHLFRPLDIDLPGMQPTKGTIARQLLKDRVKSLLPRRAVLALRGNNKENRSNEFLLKWYLERVKRSLNQ